MSHQTEMTIQRKRFKYELEKFISTIQEIDKNTPWEPREPEWWLEMRAVEKQCHMALKAIEKRYNDNATASNV